MEYDVEFLKGTLKENACDLMGKFKFPQKIINDFHRKDIVYMSLPNGSLTTNLPNIVQKEINDLRKTALVYHVIADYTTWSFITCYMYNVLFVEKDMMIMNNYIWLPSSSINITVPKWSEIGDIYVTRKGKCMRRTG